MVSLRAPRCDDVVFLQGLSERVRHFKLKRVATLVTSSSSASRPSPLGLGGCLCKASTAHTFNYRLIYSRTRAYQTRPAVELVSSKEGLSLPPPLFLLWVVLATLRTQVRPAIEFVSGKEDLRPRIAVFNSWCCNLRVQVFTRTHCGFGGHGSKLLEASALLNGAVLGVRRHSKASDTMLEHRRGPLAQPGRMSGLARDMLTR